MELGKLRQNRYPADISIYTREGMVLKEKGVLARREQQHRKESLGRIDDATTYEKFSNYRG